METLTFKKLFLYDLRRSGITVPVKLAWGGCETELKAKVDYDGKLYLSDYNDPAE